MTSASRQQPPWQSPPELAAGIRLPELYIYNSLTREKNKFIPLDPEGKKVTWYACGPTVYDDAHLGHARNYVSTDIIRRIMRDYFKFDLKFVMNITDVDDKIILRGRQQYLFSQFASEHPQLGDEVISAARSAFGAYAKKNLPLVPADIQPESYDSEIKRVYGHVLEGKSLAKDSNPPGDKEAKIKMHAKTAGSAAEALAAANKDPKSVDITEFYAKTEDAFLPYLDSLYGASINAKDYEIFTRLTKKFEDRFVEDMRALNYLDPDVVTRVTEYGPQIITFVDKIVRNNFGYVTSDGSVYFDINSFEKAGNHYARLEPWNRNDKDLQADGEGALSKKTTEKRSDADFALWKSSKPGEPSWTSPWGEGRPGWHIECSAMASEVLGENMDIHSGGVDLRFPHHDNEIAQSEAFWAKGDCDGHAHQQHQWVNYFIHMGHLSIAGSKMSKSLKNFTTIREALSRGDWTPRGLRIVFLLGGWKDGVEITEGLVKEGQAWEDKVTNFFLKARDLERNPPSASSLDAESDSSLATALATAQQDFHNALCDSFDTPKALAIIASLITKYNSVDETRLTTETILGIARWVTQMVTIFGLDSKADLNDSARIGWSGTDIPKVAKPFIYPVARLRDEVRKKAIAGKLDAEELGALVGAAHTDQPQDVEAVPYAEILTGFQTSVKELSSKSAPAKEFLALCDKLRDVHLWDQGIYLEDREGRPAMVRPVDKELRAARAAKEELAKKKAAAKAQREKEEAEKARKRAELAKVSPLKMFRTQEYSAWDDEGLPVRDAKGDEVPKSKTKKLRKEWEKQRKLHEEWKKTQGEGSAA